MMIIDLPGFWHDEDLTLGQAPIIVDLSQVRIDEMTNLPSKAEFGPEDRKATVEERQPEQYTNDTAPEPEPQPEPEQQQQVEETPDETPEEIKDDFLEPPVPTQKPQPKQEPKPQQAPRKPAPIPTRKPKPKPNNKPVDTNKKQQEQAKVRSNALKSLMQELDNNKNIDIGDKTQSAMIKEGTEVKHMGIEGGNSNGSYFSDLTISETDAIASLLSQNWNLDPGAIGIEGMVVKIRVSLAKDGTIKKIEFVDSKTRLQEKVQAVSKTLEYVLVSEEGPAHNRLYTSDVYVGGEKLGTGSGKTKKSAEQHAACEALKRM
ncbi:MAG: putative dsRNA-binding protein [Alphaproteobacteria bacterium]|nr:putative dsRNA-binding protein [Alphaproteobacteria bacterium]